MKKVLAFLPLFLSALAVLQAQTDIQASSSADRFTSDSWPVVLSAKEAIENTGAGAIETIMPLLRDCRQVKLQQTGDLIYPGAERFYGHGQMIDYDIDIVCIRAGWLLEELTFENFGFSGTHLSDEELLIFAERNFREYFNTPGNLEKCQSMEKVELRRLIRQLSIEKAEAWWKTGMSGWNRLHALKDALSSADERRQARALFYIRNGKTSCPGLTKKFYATHLESQIRQLAKADLTRISENAKLILLDTRYDWLTIKE